MIFRVKQFLLAVLYRLDQHLPLWLGVCLRNRCWPWRPVLDAVELHLADRCNMNCTGCSHFSPFAEEWFPDEEQIARDLSVLRERMAGGIRHVNLLGGEPLLHANVCSIVRRVREICPRARITLVTNGMLLLRQTDEFWEMCRQARVRLNFTLYGPMSEKREAIEARCRAEGIPLRVQRGEVFFARMVPDGSSDPERAFRFCRKGMYCPYLREGRLYKCAQAYHVRDFIREARKAGVETADVVDEGLDINDTRHSGMGILRYLMTPGKVCCCCSESMRLMPWSSGSRDVRDWFRHRD